VYLYLSRLATLIFCLFFFTFFFVVSVENAAKAARLINNFCQVMTGTFVSKHIFVLIVFLVLMGSLTVCVHAQTFTVPPLSEQTVNVNLSEGDFVNGTVSVSGGTGTGVDFVVSDPNGKELLCYNYTSYTSFSFSASINGTYILSFDNSFCSCVGGKTVSLDYSVNDNPVQVSSQSGSNKPVQVSAQGGSIGGFPLVVVLGLVFVIVVVAAVVILMRRPRTNTNNATASP
jgi:hypothetical protein